ncbi:rRNA processing/ribosome biogenesis-domain-containing protein [Rhizoctonia solani]|nr:rRNA processing/ribosome biogenesis-domain-containing protein [Rhizoctonia solani]
MSSAKHPLELLLQNHLGTDDALSTLQQPDIFGEARVLGKWNARINSFLHSREAASRWVGLCLARYTALGSRQILVDNAQGWVGVVLPMLSKPESAPNHYAAIRLLSYVFTAVTDMPEFQRQVVIPNIQKCSQALLALAKNSETEFELKLLVIDTLTQLTTYHPTHHKALHQHLLSFTLEHLQGSFPLPSNASLLIDNQPPHLSPQLSVGAGMIWRQSLDSTMGTIWVVLETLRSTYLDVPRPSATIAPFSFPELPVDPALAGPIALDRFRGMVRLLVHLLETPTSRPVSIPLGALAHLTLALLRFNAESVSQSIGVVYEAAQRVNEVAIVPELCVQGTCGKLFTPYVSQVFIAITLQLEQNITTTRRIRILATIPPILANVHSPAPSSSYNRLAAQVLKILSPLLPSSRTFSQIQTPQESVKGKKRTRYEGDELFSSHSSSSSSNPPQPDADDELYAAALFALAALLPTLPLTTQTTIHRTLLALLLHLPRKGNSRRLVQKSSSGTLNVGVQALKAIEKVSCGLLDPRSMIVKGICIVLRPMPYTWYRPSPYCPTIPAPTHSAKLEIWTNSPMPLTEPSAPSIPTNSFLPSTEAPQPSAAIPASSLFRSSGDPDATAQAPASSAPTEGPSSRPFSIPDNDEDDEPMPQIDLGLDTDDEE